MRTATTLTVLMLIMMAFPTEAKAQTKVSTWGALKDAVAAGGDIELTALINASERITVNKTVTLDLHGYEIKGNNLNTNIFIVNGSGDLTITDLSGDNDGKIYGVQSATNISTIYIAGTGKLTLAAGTIGGPNIGVAADVGGNFTMTGGTINTGYSTSGIGVDLDESSSFTMSGGTITGNSIGVNIRSNNYPATMTVSGNVNISGNTTGDVSLAYVYNAFSPICIGDNLTANARIGVWTNKVANEVRGMTFTSGLNLNNKTPKGSASNFFISNSRRNDLGILPNGNELCFAIVDNNNSSGALQVLVDYEGGEYAVLDCNYTGNVPVSIAASKTVAGVLVYRNFNTGIDEKAYSTLMLPFAVSTAKLEGISAIYSFGGVDVVNGKKAVIVDPVWDTSKDSKNLLANTPYLVKMSSPTLGVEGGVTLNRLVADPCVEKNDWCLWGTLGYIKWTDDTNDEYYDSKRASEIGSVYGFAASSDGNVSVGEFVKVESGSSIKPFRAYLQHISNTTRGLTRGDDDEELPDRMSVIVRDSSSETGILKVKSEKPDEAWYALDGRQLNGKPSMKGVYINGGRKVVIK